MHRAVGRFIVAIAMLVGSLSEASAEPGFVEGHISIGPLTPVHRVGMPTPKPSRETYAAYKVTVFKADGETKISELTPNDEGNYRLTLPPGDYVLDRPHRRAGGSKDLPRSIKIVSGQTVRVDIAIDTGMR
jgi:hypothetical protein